MRRLDHAEIRVMIKEEAMLEERRRLDEGWLEILGDVGMQVVNSPTGRKVAAKALRGMASIVLIPTKMDEKQVAKQSQALATIVSLGKSVGGLTQLASALEGAAKMLESMSDEDAKQVLGVAQQMRKAGSKAIV